jgi:hypothetical protein
MYRNYIYIHLLRTIGSWNMYIYIYIWYIYDIYIHYLYIIHVIIDTYTWHIHYFWATWHPLRCSRCFVVHGLSFAHLEGQWNWGALRPFILLTGVGPGRNEDLPEKCGPPVMFVGFSTPWASIMIYIYHKPYLTWLFAPTLALTNQRWTGDLVKVGSIRPHNDHNDLSTQSGFFQNLLLARVCVSAFLCVCIYIYIIYIIYISGWWFGTCVIFHFINGMSSFLLTHIFQDG